jgi:hypothetical protein
MFGEAGARGKTGRFLRESEGAPALPARGALERTGIEPVTSGLQSRRSPS